MHCCDVRFHSRGRLRARGLGLAVLAALFHSAAASAAVIVGLTEGNQIVSFNSGSPGSVSTPVTVTGLQPGEVLLGIDYRPATGQLFGLGSASRLYTLNATSGVANQVGMGMFAVGLSGTAFAFDFNPMVDRIRVVSNTGQNLRLNPITGGVVDSDMMTPGTQIDGSPAFTGGDDNEGTTPRVAGAAYSNNVAGAMTTTLYFIDTNLDILTRVVPPPNNGVLATVGPLEAATDDRVGFDIQGGTDAAFASLTPDGGATSSLYTINLNDGSASLIGEIDGQALVDIAVNPVPEPGTFAMLGAGLAAALVAKRRRSQVRT